MNNLRSGLDANGFIVKEVSLHKIKQPFVEPLNRSMDEILSNFKDQVHSIYVYGSVATGEAESPASDLDILVILQSKATTLLQKKCEALQGELSEFYKSKFREVGIAVTYKDEVLTGKQTFGWAFFVQILCERIHGNTLYRAQGNYKPTKELAKQLHGDLAEVLKDYAQQIKAEPDTEKNNLYCKSAVKKLIRAAFCMLMQEENAWSTNLQYMGQIFIKHYPDKQLQMLQSLEHANEACSDKQQVLELLSSFGSWLITEFEKTSN